MPLAALLAALGCDAGDEGGAPAGGGAAASAEFDREWEAGQDAFNRGDLAEARRRFERARELAPDKPGPWRWLARVARVQGRGEECVEASTTALRLRLDTPHREAILQDLEACRAMTPPR